MRGRVRRARQVQVDADSQHRRGFGEQALFDNAIYMLSIYLSVMRAMTHVAGVAK